MAITILPREESVGSQFGTGLGAGLSSGLQNLVNLKMQQLQHQQNVARGAQFWKGLGLPDQMAYQFASAPEAVQKNLLERLEGLQIGVQQQQPQNGMKALQSLQPPLQEQPSLLSPAALGMFGQGPQVPSVQELIGQQQPQQQSQLPQVQQQGGLRIGASPIERRHRETLAQQEKLLERRLSAKQQELVDKETLPVYKEIIKGAKAAEENDKRLDRMTQLVEKGNLGIPAVNSALKSLAKGIFGFGLDLTSLMTADAQELEKLSSQFASGAKDVFPGRVTNTDLEMYMKQIPNLSQSGAGIRRIIASMKSANEASKLRKQALDEIIKENNGRRPANLDLLIEEKIGPQLDVLAKEFINAPLIPEKLGGGIVRY